MTDTKRRRREQAEPSPAPYLPTAPSLDRAGLWVVVSGRMKQYGDYVIERPGQIIRQQHLKNDDLLIKHNYVRPLADHEEATKCDRCGLMFLGDALSGSYRSHLATARHDLAGLDLDTGLSTSDGKRHRAGNPNADPDADDSSEWDLEPEGAPGARHLEDESPRGVRVSMG